MCKDLFLHSQKFIAGAAKPEQIPNLNLPEVAFIGRSNVGKSSIINALTRNKKLARTSQNPGCTQQINFFKIGEKFCLVDLPGYGFAKISFQAKKNLEVLIHGYLTHRTNLKNVYILVDSRHPIKEIDLQAIEFLSEYNIPFSVVLTKLDKSKILSDVLAQLNKLLHDVNSFNFPILPTSVSTGVGIEALKKNIFRYVI